MPEPRDPGRGDAATPLHLRDLFTAVVLLSILPYLSRGIARSLGAWVLIAPAVALSLAIFGGFLIYLDSRPIYSIYPPVHSRDRQWATAGLLLTLVVGAALNTSAVAAVWIQPQQDGKAAQSGTSDLNAVAASSGVMQFARAADEKTLSTAPDLTVMLPYVRGMLSRIACGAYANPSDPMLTRDFMCTLRPSTTPSWPACQFIWSLLPVYAGGGLAIVENRDDVIRQFNRSGYGKGRTSRANQSAAPYVGVAFVRCPSGLGKPGAADLRVAFVLSTASQIKKYLSAFRTVGFDWIDPDYLDAPYIAELFSLASLYRVTQIIATDKTRFAHTMTSTAHDALFDVKAIQALRGIESVNDIRVGNRSDGQLGNSRGSCLLVAQASGLTKGSVRVHIAPSAVTPDLSIADRSLVLVSRTSELVSLPCTLVSALATRNMQQAENYPAKLTGTTLSYRIAPGESKQDAQRAAYNIRAAGLTLYLLGFNVDYNTGQTPDRDQVIGFWPRSGLIGTKTR